MKDTFIHAVVPEDLFNTTNDIFDKLGIDMQTAIRMFLMQVEVSNGLPFNPTVKKEVKVVNEVKISQNLPSEEIVRQFIDRK